MKNKIKLFILNKALFLFGYGKTERFFVICLLITFKPIHTKKINHIKHKTT